MDWLFLACFARKNRLDFCGNVSSVASLKFIEEQPQILRLTTPELKDVRGPVRSE
jgi:hypothetical protein